MIKFDLHIHSIASKYKESAGVVDESTIENAEVLFQKLNETGIGLFSITDHNRFFPELYIKLDEIIQSAKYSEVKGLVAGVEFDVKIDEKMSPCHIITIFDAKSRNENYQRIYQVIENHKLNRAEGFYNRSTFESILREIGLDVILIACQRSGLDRHDDRTRSLSGSTLEPEELLSSGYINALEFQRPNVEGILLNNLRSIPQHVMLVRGSDCHEWTAYPKHDKAYNGAPFIPSRANILPTFKGLLMAVTSPETRINPQENRNREYVRTLYVQDNEIPLVNGFVAIIGENGSGKSSLIKILHEKTDESFVKRIKENNNISFSRTDVSKRLFIEQGQIVDSFGKDNLFPADNYIPVDHTLFRNTYEEFANKVLDYVKRQIKAKEAINQLRKEELQYNELAHATSYFINLLVEDGFSEVNNPHDTYDQELNELLEKILPYRTNEYYKEFQTEWNQIIEILSNIYTIVHNRYDSKVVERLTKNHIVSASVEYDRKVGNAANSQQRDQRDFLDSREAFISFIVNAAKLNSEENLFPALPTPIRGYSTNPMHGFSFNLEAVYHDKDVLESFLDKMFVNEYKSIEALKKIDTYEELQKAVFRCATIDQIDELYQKNLNSFFEEMCKCRRYIVDTSQDGSLLGNTLGEMSLAYFKYMTEHETEKAIFLIDQPEDHISNNNISQKLLNYFNYIRRKKQVIIITHNPLLVVNQDVDQVLFIRKHGEKVEVISGCLEYEDDNVNMLDIIAKNMDGGKASIEKRLKVYGKENHTDYAAQ